MARFDSGVKAYVHGSTTIDVYFPIDGHGTAHISCSQCFFFRKNYQTCGLTGDVTAFPDKFVGTTCPLEIVSVNEPVESKTTVHK